jgi:long-chain fatty acid transport protein
MIAVRRSSTGRTQLKTNTGIFVAALASALATASTAGAGGFSRGTANTDILFQDGMVNLDNSVAFVNPNRKYDTNPVPALNGSGFSESYIVPNLAAKYSINDNLSCAFTYTTPFGGDSKLDVLDSRGKLEEKFRTDEYGATCAVFMPMETGRIAVLGGVFYEQFKYEFDGATRLGPMIAPLNFDVKSHEWGWRAGIAYEIPEYAFRTQLLYRSGTDHSGNSTAHLPTFGMTLPVSGEGSLPQSLELKAQTGVAPGWLVFGSVKWTDWSALDRLDLTLGGRPFSNIYEWRDGWTFTAGVGHEFTDRISGALTLAYDRGVSTGWDYYGDSYIVGVTAGVKDDWGGKLSASFAAAFQEGVQETKNAPGLNASTKDSIGTAVQVRYDLPF